jgi:hypothetical protein
MVLDVIFVVRISLLIHVARVGRDGRRNSKLFIILYLAKKRLNVRVSNVRTLSVIFI